MPSGADAPPSGIDAWKGDPRLDLVVLRHRLLNIVDGDQFFCNASKSRSASRTKSMVIARP